MVATFGMHQVQEVSCGRTGKQEDCAKKWRDIGEDE